MLTRPGKSEAEVEAEACSDSHCNLLNKNAQLSLTNPRDAKPCQKLLQFDVKTSYRQLNNLLEL